MSDTPPTGDDMKVTGSPITGKATVTPDAPKTGPAPPPAAPAAAPATNTAGVITKYAKDGKGPASAQIIQDLSSGLKSLHGVTVQAKRTETQSPEAKVGAVAALKNAIETQAKRFKAAVEHFGEGIATAIKDELIVIHSLTEAKNAEEVVANLTPVAEAPTE